MINQRSLRAAAEAAAAQEPGLADRAKTNTTAMLAALPTRLGFEVATTVEGE